MTTRKIVVIGGSGFIGSRLVPRLRALGHSVRIADVQPPAGDEPDFVEADVRDADAMKKAVAGTDTIYNLAAEHRDDVRPLSLYDEVNVDGARNVCAAADAHGITHQIFTSSVAVYGLKKQRTDETAEPDPFNDYGRTKALAEDVYRGWFEAGEDRTLSILRPTVVFGPNNRGNVYNLLRQLSSGLFVMIGSGENRKSMAYVDNVAAALVFLLDRPRGSFLYNYVDQPDMNMNDLVRAVREALGKTSSPLRLPQSAGLAVGWGFDRVAGLTGRNFPISEVRVRKFTAETRFAADRIRHDGFEPVVTLEDGLRKTIASEFETGNAKADRAAAE